MASTDSMPVPKKNTAYRLYVEVYNTSGKIITGGITGADTELSKDGAAFADATNEFTEIGTSGCGYVELTAGEMNYDHVHVVFKCSNTSAMDVSVHLYPEEAGDIRANVTQISGSATAADYLEIGALLNVPFTVAGTPSATVFESDDVTNATADLYNGRFVIFRTGALANKATKITDYEKVGSNGSFTVDSLGSAPSAGDTGVIL